MTAGRVRIPTETLWHGAIAVRVITLGYATAVLVTFQDEYARPTLAWSVYGVMVAWTIVTTAAYLRERTRPRWLVVVDVALTFGLMPLTLLTHTPQMLAAHDPLITTLWVNGALIACALRFGTPGGMVAAVVLSIGTGIANGRVNLTVLSDTVLLMLAGTVFGMCMTALIKAGEERAQAMRIEAATAERERLARSIHDGVLQVLAQVHRRGRRDEKLADLAALAADQEVALRALVASEATPGDDHPTEEDLNRAIRVLGTQKVQVSTPAGEILLPVAVVRELVAVIREALSNVDRHAGSKAKTWVFVEDVGDEVVVSVRDDGDGIPEGRLEEAAAQGRLGVVQSIKGRVADLGGTITLDTAVGAGTEWEIHVPRRPVRKDHRR